MEETINWLRRVKRSFSIVGFGFSVLLAVALAAQFAFLYIPPLLGWDALIQKPWWTWVSSSAPMYLFAFPACILFLQFLPGKAPESHVLTKKQFFTLLPMCFCLMYAGNLVGTLLSFLLSGGQAVNELNSYAMDQHPLKIVVMVILAPVLEELLCRKILIDRTARYGEKISVLMSGLIFGLLHGNLFQFFYAFALGCLFAYVYIRTGRIRYTMIFHAIVNFMGAVVAPAVLNLLPTDIIPDLQAGNVMLPELVTALFKYMLVAAYSTTLMGLSVFGLVLLILKRRQLIWKEAEQQVPGKQALKAALLNVGMIVYLVFCLAMIVLALFNN